ncbi:MULTISPECIES: porin family protein [Microbulbifer]|uniref:Porin family protein n=1 Tax=Microbulbifer celer TaxID=435905 RepID=A0ABW3UCF6_9GAMM|nr:MULTISPECIES: porin family protein [Microbulbifer]UFN56377.1 porin family protein [Microbulbifer celer]
MLIRNRNLLVAALATLISSTTAAQEMNTIGPVNSVYQGSWSFHGELFNFDSQVARYEGISDSGYGLGAGYSGEKGLFNFNVGLGVILIDDKDKFEQYVEDEDGDTFSKDSSISAVTANIDAGIQYPVSRSGNFVLGLNIGFRQLEAEREIANCSDCFTEGVGLGSETYLKPFAKMQFSKRFDGTLALFNYAGDKGLDNSVQFSLNWKR